MSVDPTVDSRGARPGSPGDAGNGKRAVHSMEVRNLHKSFGSASILSGLDLMFQDDAITTILGPSGTG
ncbi:MAG: phospholipid/cholesterol/gamma-HCH transport system ATP-binding protein, partial [Pseudonocardiales bacterium]|nr:phospholipid/cholesterol/gamma-HCH transport system ATP-binding protein [Pseudonocardiales bacterium]